MARGVVPRPTALAVVDLSTAEVRHAEDSYWVEQPVPTTLTPSRFLLVSGVEKPPPPGAIVLAGFNMTQKRK